MTALVIAEHNNQTLNAATLNAAAAAARLSGGFDVLVAGHQCGAVATQAAAILFPNSPWMGSFSC